MKRYWITGFLLMVLAAVVYSQSVVTSNDTVLSGQVTVTATAANLGTTAIKTLCVVAATGNGSAIYFGGSNVTTSNGLILNANNSICVNVKNLGAVYLVGSGTASWEATK